MPYVTVGKENSRESRFITRTGQRTAGGFQPRLAVERRHDLGPLSKEQHMRDLIRRPGSKFRVPSSTFPSS